ncbi:hypothetical protein [Sinorhizobium sp. NFACC03]|uniref:hypothetical protein n=1 Tax=Sinorhizobium sp. NFACC03 TaxID=1566295 RepID=UPI000ABC234D|nr:hypothetical protein [Sinorhizobium sp. NFACC03]
MLFRQHVLAAIASGDVTLAFRRWTKPTVRAGGTLRTAVGVLAIDAVDEIEEGAITDGDARKAGFADLGALLRAAAIASPSTEPATIRASRCGKCPTSAAKNGQRSAASSMTSTAARAWPGRDRCSR